MKIPEHFYKEVAASNNLSIKIVSKINRYYWKYGVRKNLSESNHRSIFIKNIGTITTSRYKLNAEIKKFIHRIRKISNSSFLTERRKELIIDKVKVNLTNLLKLRNEIAIDFYNKSKKYLNEQMD